MSKDVSVSNIYQFFKEFANEKGYVEVATRSQNSAFKPYYNVYLDPSSTEEQELGKKALKLLNKNTKLNERNLSLLTNVSKVQNISLLLNGLNLCATGVGFAIIFKKLDKESNKLSRQINQLQSIVKQTQDLHNEAMFNIVLAEHMDMLDCQRRQRPYSEAQMRKLVDMEHIVLSLLISSFQKGISEDNNATILAIFSLLAMFTVSLRTFDELYYFNNHEVLGEDAWHLSHDRWMEVYDTLTSQWFIEKLQDHGTFETSLSTAEVDAYYISLLDQVKDCRCEIKDNQSLIIAMGDADLFRQYKELSTKEVVDSIEAAYREAGRDMDMDESTVMSAFHNAMQQVAMV